MNIPKSSYRSGLTLIELLAVIAIIGILGATIFANITSTRAKARDAKRLTEIKSLRDALNLYNDANSAYPISEAGYAIPPVLSAMGIFSTTPVESLYPGTEPYRYIGIDDTGGDCTVGEVCVDYVVAAFLEKTDNPALAADSDRLLGFAGLVGNSDVGCLTASAGGSERCYDVGP